MDPEVHGGAPLLGFNGAVMKAHGSARERAIMNAIRVTAEAIQHHVNDIISTRNRRSQRAHWLAAETVPLPGYRSTHEPSRHPTQISKTRAPSTIFRAAPAPSPASAPMCPTRS